MASAPTEGDAGQVNKTLNLKSVGAAAQGGDRATLEGHEAPPIRVDYVIVFSLLPPKGSTASRTSHAQNIKHEYGEALKLLKQAGLQATGRPGAKGKNEILILVKASEARIKEEVEKERLNDWLHGITSKTPEGQRKKRDFASEPSTPAERLRHVYNIITLTGPSPGGDADSILAGPGAGIQPQSAAFTHVKSIFPPHDPKFNRSWLKRWSDRGHVRGIPDREFDEIRDHFGEAIAFYFAFLRAYFRALIVPTVFGAGTWLLGAQFSPVYAFLLILWATAFVEGWAVRERVAAVNWHTYRCEAVEKERPEFLPLATETDPVTGQQTGSFPWWRRELRQLVTVPVLGAFVVSLGGLITCITGIELLVNEVYNGPGKMYLSLLPTVLFAGIVPQLVSAWHVVALRLTSWENHLHPSTYDRSLTLKMFALNTVPAYMGLLLTSFVYIPFGQLLIPHLASLFHIHVVRKERIPGLKGSDLDDDAFNWKSYEVDGGRLHKQILAYTVTNQIVNAFTELGLPIILRFVGEKVAEFRSGGGGGGGGGKKGQEKEETVEGGDEEEERAFLKRIRDEAGLPEYTLFVDYAEMVVQFGYVVVWTVVWPIAPLFAYINNFFELRGDALKLATQCRRPTPQRVDTIGPWLDALRFLAWFGALVNAALVYLFRPSPQANAEAIAKAVKDSDQTVTEKATAFVTSHIGRAMSLGGETGGPDRYYTLRGVLFTAILAALAAEHVQLLVRGVMAHLAEHLFWIGSEAEIRQRKADWELKRSFLATINMDTDGRRLVRGDTVKSLDQGGEGDWAKMAREEGETSEEGKRFWGRKDQGVAEVDRATKTD